MKNAILLAAMAAAPGLWADPAAVTEQYYQAIRNNNIPALKSLIKSGNVNARDNRETTPLMFAAAYGSRESVRLLLEAGADVNARNAFNATALMWAASDLDKVTMLVAKGADPNARSKQGRTPLLIAAQSDHCGAIVKYLLDSGADPSAKDAMGQTALHAATAGDDTAAIRMLMAKGLDVNARDAQGLTPLMWAAMNGNLAIVRELIAKGADVNAVSGAAVNPPVKNGPIALGSFTALALASTQSDPAVVKALLDAGAHANPKDVRGMTPLMLAVATDHPSIGVIRMLVDRGADLSIKSNAGESAIDWAHKYENPPVLAALGIARAAVQPPAIVPAANSKAVAPAVAARRGVELLQRTSASFFQEGGCASCHSQNITGVAVAVARSQGIAVNEAAAAGEAKGTRLGWSSFEQMLLQRLDPPAGPDMPVFAMLQLAAAEVPGGSTTDAMVHNLAAMQRAAGNWHLGGISRAPVEDGDFSRTALAIRSLREYGPAGRGAEFSDRIGRAAGWLKSAMPRTTEDRDMQILGLVWAGADPEFVAEAVEQLKRKQQADGGWAQTADLSSDAYATGQAVYTLHEAGVPSTDPIYRRGVEYLVRTQHDDGSWYVKSRAPKFQPYFQSGFPYDHDQWISAMGTAWAVMGLSYAAPEKPVEQASR